MTNPRAKSVTTRTTIGWTGFQKKSWGEYKTRKIPDQEDKLDPKQEDHGGLPEKKGG
jgi:hypothetical protein